MLISVQDEQLDSAPFSAALKNGYGTYVYVNRAIEEAFGCAPGVMLGKTDYHLQPDREAAILRQHDRQVLTTGRDFNSVEIAKLPDGRDGIWLVHKFLIESNGLKFLGVLGVQVMQQAAEYGFEKAVEEAEMLIKEQAEPYRGRLIKVAELLARRDVPPDRSYLII